jgi:hypothetical protein
MLFVISWVNRLSSRYGPPVSIFAFKSYCDRRLAIEPRPRLLELRGQSKQRRLVAVARDELNRDWEFSRGRLRYGVGPRQRQDDRRLARQVEAP